MSFGGGDEARIQQLIASEQQALAREERQTAIGLSRRTPSEIELRNNLNQIRQQVLGQSQRELAFLQQGLDLNQPGAYEEGRGLFSSVLLRQRAPQRQLLESQLRQRFGAGYATTSAGQAALQQFDTQTTDLATSLIPNILQSQTAAITQQAAFENAIMGRELSAVTRTSMVPYAGTQYVGELINARQDAINRNQLFQAGGQIVGSAIGAAIGGPAGATIGGSAGQTLGNVISPTPTGQLQLPGSQGQLQNVVQQPVSYSYITPTNYPTYG